MKTLSRLLTAVVLSVALVGCANSNVQYRHTASFPPADLLKDYQVAEPPAEAVEYSKLNWETKEEMWVDYTLELLVVIKKHMADKKGILQWESSLKESLDKLNKAKEQ